MRTYTIIGGVNGVGKSSFTGLLKEQRSDLGIIIDVDKITAELGGNTLARGRAALKKIRDCIEQGYFFYPGNHPLRPPHRGHSPGIGGKRVTVYGCTISVWTAPPKAFPALQTV